MFDFFKDQNLIAKIISSVIFIISLFILKYFISQSIRKQKFSHSDVKRKWLVQSRNALFIFFIMGLIVIWASELRALAVSVLAIGIMAFAITTKEFILCFMGGFYKSVNRPFSIGDRIEVDDFRGDVIDENIISTTLLEVGPKNVVHQRTGRSITLPNSIFLDHPIINESFTDDFVFHVFTVVTKASHDISAHEKSLLDASNEECSSYIDEATTYMKNLHEKHSLDIPTVEPKIWLHISKHDEIQLYIRVPVPTLKKGRIEQAILRKYLKTLSQQNTLNP